MDTHHQRYSPNRFSKKIPKGRLNFTPSSIGIAPTLFSKNGSDMKKPRILWDVKVPMNKEKDVWESEAQPD